ncbi:MAG: alpha/beta family hydrolase [Ectobacillus sp.]
MKANNKAVRAKEREIKYTHLEMGSQVACFMFSGAGYTYEKPLLYYATMVLLQHNIDVVQIHYSYEEGLLKRDFAYIAGKIMDDVNPVVLDVLENRQYAEMIFLGKSLGTIPVVHEFMKNAAYVKAKMILLTPLLKFEAIYNTILHSKHQGLLVIGDQDPHYNSEQIEHLKQSNLEIEVIPNANHSLDIEHFAAVQSIASLSRVIGKLQETITDI